MKPDGLLFYLSDHNPVVAYRPPSGKFYRLLCDDKTFPYFLTEMHLHIVQALIPIQPITFSRQAAHGPHHSSEQWYFPI